MSKNGCSGFGHTVAFLIPDFCSALTNISQLRDTLAQNTAVASLQPAQGECMEQMGYPHLGSKILKRKVQKQMQRNFVYTFWRMFHY
jgi:hypothetical protein